MEHVTSLSGDGQQRVVQRFGEEINGQDGGGGVQNPHDTLENVPFVGISAKDVDRSSELTRTDITARGDKSTAGGDKSTARGFGVALGEDMGRPGLPEIQRMSTARASTTFNTGMAETTPIEGSRPRPSSYPSSSESGWTPAPPSAPATTTGSIYELDQPNTTTGLATAMTAASAPYASTTDDDDAASLYAPSASNASLYNASNHNTASFQAAAAMSLPRRRLNRVTQHTSLSTVQSPTDLALEEEWDYSETEWWGWIILIATWVVFVVGMGSCLGFWSWAWDVGETPYAPPELEDDPTLPITGYYPALMVCTAIMAWVWVVVAWVGMKYFRHAKMVSDDS